MNWRERKNQVKWHFYDESHELCEIGRKSFTACHRELGEVFRHTRDEKLVDCIMCVKVLNKFDEEHYYKGELK